MTLPASALLSRPDEDIIRNIPRHPADPTVAYGEALDREFGREYIVRLVKDRILSAAIFPNAVSRQEIAEHITPELQRAFREACQHFTHFFFTQEKRLKTDLMHGVAVMRGLGYRGQGFGPETVPRDYEGGKTLRDFLPDNWLIDQISKHGDMVATRMGEYGFHAFHAFPGMTGQLWAGKWHTHEDYTTHLTLAGAGLEWLPSYIESEDAEQNPAKYEHLIQRLDIGDLMVMGRANHRSSHFIPEQGQFAFIAHGPYDLTHGD